MFSNTRDAYHVCSVSFTGNHGLAIAFVFDPLWFYGLLPYLLQWRDSRNTACTEAPSVNIVYLIQVSAIGRCIQKHLLTHMRLYWPNYHNVGVVRGVDHICWYWMAATHWIRACCATNCSVTNWHAMEFQNLFFWVVRVSQHRQGMEVSRHMKCLINACRILCFLFISV